MANIHWLNPISGGFTNAADWSGGVVPGASDDAVLDAAGPAFTVTASTSVAVKGIETATNATLDIAAGMFTATNGTDASANAGKILVEAGSTLAVGGAILGSGAIDLNSPTLSGDATALLLDANTTFSGGGSVTLSDSTYNHVYSNGPATLTNINDTISGAGRIGSGSLTLVNQSAGVIDATGTHGLVINTFGTVTNAGLMEATGSGYLHIFSEIINSGTLRATGAAGLSLSGTVANTGLVSVTGAGGLSLFFGTIDDTKGGVIAPLSKVALTGGVILGGALTLSAGGVMTVVDYNSLLAASTLTNLGTIDVSAHSSLKIQGAIVNHGGIDLNATFNGDGDRLELSGDATLSGGGALTLSNSRYNDFIDYRPATFTNVDNTISGAGTIGSGGMTLINQTAGVIDGNGVQLIVDTGNDTIANAGTIEATAGGSTTIQSAVANTGTIEAGGGTLTVNAAVTGTGSAVVAGGTLTFTSAFNESVSFTGASGDLALSQSQSFTNTIAGLATSGGSVLDLGDITFTSGVTKATFADNGHHTGGVLTVTDGTHTARLNLVGDFAGASFTAASDGHGGTTVAKTAAHLHWLNSVNGSFSTASDWTAGLVPGAQNDAVLDAPGSTPYTVTASGSLTVLGVQTAASASLAVTGVFTATNGTDDGASAGKITVATGGVLKMAGAIANAGTISLNSSGAATYLGIGDNTTLSGGGAVSLAGSNAKEDVIYGLDSTASLTNVDNTIAGAGDLGEGRLTLINQAAGVIDANGPASLALLTGGTVVNAGLIEATGSGGLSILSAVNNAGGGVIAAAGGKVYLEGADILGGTLRSSGGKFIYVASGVDTLDGTASTANIQGEVVIENGQNLNLVGGVSNAGFVVLVSDGAATSLTIGAANAILLGGGQVFMVNSAEKIIGATASSTLYNVANVIAGTGDVGGGRMTLNNGAAGVIVGEGSVAALVVDTGANTIVNAGRIENTGKGGTLVKSAVNNTGVLIAEGGTLTVTGPVTGTGVGVIYAGTLAFASSFSQTVAFKGPSGRLQLAQSQGFAATISGFSTTGGTPLDLGDIGFVNAGEATYSGTTTSGILTVTDGVHTARIHLTGNYLASTFTASSDGHGGTIVVDPTKAQAGVAPTTLAPAHRFIAAMAGLGVEAAGTTAAAHEAWRPQPATLARPGAAIA